MHSGLESIGSLSKEAFGGVRIMLYFAPMLLGKVAPALPTKTDFFSQNYTVSTSSKCFRLNT